MPIAVIAPLNDTVQPSATEQSLTFYTQLLSEGVLWGLVTTAQGVPDLTVNVSAGFGIINTNNDLKKHPFASVGGVLAFGSAPSAGNSRIDLVVVAITVVNGNQTTATIDVIAGTPATTGTQVAPVLAETSVLCYLILAQVTITGASSAITSGQIVTTGTITNTSNVNLKPISGATVFEIRAISTIYDGYIESGRFVEKTGDTLTGKLQFSGTGHAGLRLNNLTTAQRDSLTPQIGDQIFNTDTGVLETRTAIGWVGGIAQKQINATKIFVEQNFS